MTKVVTFKCSSELSARETNLPASTIAVISATFPLDSKIMAMLIIEDVLCLYLIYSICKADHLQATLGDYLQENNHRNRNNNKRK